MKTVDALDTIPGSIPQRVRTGRRPAVSGFRAQEPLLELARIAGLPFGARWLFLANGRQWGPFVPWKQREPEP